MNNDDIRKYEEKNDIRTKWDKTRLEQTRMILKDWRGGGK